jgi:hypothetical protein
MLTGRPLGRILSVMSTWQTCDHYLVITLMPAEALAT